MFNRLSNRHFSVATPLQLLYKRSAKLKKVEVVPTPPPITDIPERYAKYYNKCPKLLQSHMREILTHPTGFVLSIAALQQLATLVPFLTLWYTLFKIGGPDITFLPDSLMERGTTLMDHAIAKTPVANELTEEQTAAAVKSGATAYAAVSTASPLVWAFSVALAPAFRRSLHRSFSAIKTRFTSTSKATPPTPPSTTTNNTL